MAKKATASNDEDGVERSLVVRTHSSVFDGKNIGMHTL